MSIFERIERACAAFIERSFAKTFPSDLEPAQIARKLVSTMEARTHTEDGRLSAPGRYVAYVNPADFARMEPHRTYLEREWRSLLEALASRVGIAFTDGDAGVTMAARDEVPEGAVEIATDRARRFALRIVKGVSDFAVYPVDGSARIGRGLECDVTLNDPSVSRAHAVVDTDGAEPTVRDLDSTNGTFVNGARVQASRLRDGDELRFGNTQMTFEASA